MTIQMTTQECILTKILNCGLYDLKMLDDVNYDLDDIIEDCIENNDLSLHGIFRGIFYQGARDLQKTLNENIDDIKNLILEKLNDESDMINNKEISFSELKECPEHQELINDLELINNNLLQPEEDLDYFLNYLDTHVLMKHLDFYKRYINSEIEEIENNMGFTFEEWGC